MVHRDDHLIERNRVARQELEAAFRDLSKRVDELQRVSRNLKLWDIGSLVVGVIFAVGVVCVLASLLRGTF